MISTRWRFDLWCSELFGGARSGNAQHLNLPSSNNRVFRSFQALGSQRTPLEGHGWYVFSNCHLISICLSPFSSFLLPPPPPVIPTLSLRDFYISLLGWPPLIRPCLVILLLLKWFPVFGSIYSPNLTESWCQTMKVSWQDLLWRWIHTVWLMISWLPRSSHFRCHMMNQTRFSVEKTSLFSLFILLLLKTFCLQMSWFLRNIRYFCSY